MFVHALCISFKQQSLWLSSWVGWRLGLQSITGVIFFSFLLGTCYRSASLYHPQRRAILHLKSQRRKIKHKEGHQRLQTPQTQPPQQVVTYTPSLTWEVLLIAFIPQQSLDYHKYDTSHFHKELVQVLYCYSEFQLAYLQTGGYYKQINCPTVVYLPSKREGFVGCNCKCMFHFKHVLHIGTFFVRVIPWY